MSSQAQISTAISEATKEKLDRFTESHGRPGPVADASASQRR